MVAIAQESYRTIKTGHKPILDVMNAFLMEKHSGDPTINEVEAVKPEHNH